MTLYAVSIDNINNLDNEPDASTDLDCLEIFSPDASESSDGQRCPKVQR
jgi:hypothetical protein